MGRTDDHTITVPAEVYTELDTLRKLGTYDMSTEVLDGLAEHDLDTAFEWVANNPQKYAQALRDGMEPKLE